ncbi:MAG: phosphatidylserine decarboxylase [Deltaproteobacteria bacterium]|jgi:phosphatidylserine decarboxylase|nr:phosphatidylserine decarboxylase [Deltaproteobacteria bacterium]
MITIIASGLAALLIGFCYWRYIWFFRNPDRIPPAGEGILSPADGTVVYAKRIQPHDAVLVIKRGVQATINDIAREDMGSEKILIGIFMSPFDVHYNRAPLSGTVGFIHHHPAKGTNLAMWQMHLRALFKRNPYHKGSMHILQNERTVTKINGHFRGKPCPCYVVQIAAKSVSGIESYVEEGMRVERGSIFGMIRIGSQVDVIMPWQEGMQLMVRPGDKVRAGKTLLVQ